MKNLQIKYGIILAVLSSIFLTLVLFKVIPSTTLSSLTITFFEIALLVFFCFLFAKKQENVVTFNNVFVFAFKTALVMGIFVVLWSILSAKVFFVEQTLRIEEEQIKQMVAQKYITREQAKEMMKITANTSWKMWLPIMIGQGMFAAAFKGVIAGVLAGFIVPKKNKN